MNPVVRFRALVERFRHSLFPVPFLIVLGFVGLAAATLAVDAALGPDGVPEVLRTTVTSGRAVLSTVATGLVAGAALVFSSTLLAVQLASTQFSPRVLRDFLGDRFQTVVIGLIVGTATYCLIVLRQTRGALEDGGQAPLVPNVSVLIAVVLAVVSLVAIIASVNHLGQALRVESQIERATNETLALVERRYGGEPEIAVTSGSVSGVPAPLDDGQPPARRTTVIEAPVGGWVQQIATDALGSAVGAGYTLRVEAPVGSYVMASSPLARLTTSLAQEPDPATLSAITGAFAIGRARTLQQDVQLGIVRLVDIALRALSPGVNDPHTAVDAVSRLGTVLLAIHSHELPPSRTVLDDGGVLELADQPTHADFVEAAYGQIRTAGAGHAVVACSVVTAAAQVAAEVRRRGLPGDPTGLDEVPGLVLAACEHAGLAGRDLDSVRRVARQG